MKRRQKGYNTEDALALVQNGGLSDVSDFSDSSDEEEKRQPSSEESEAESDASNQDRESDVNDDNDDNEQPRTTSCSKTITRLPLEKARHASW